MSGVLWSRGDVGETKQTPGQLRDLQLDLKKSHFCFSARPASWVPARGPSPLSRFGANRHRARMTMMISIKEPSRAPTTTYLHSSYRSDEGIWYIPSLAESVPLCFSADH